MNEEMALILKPCPCCGGRAELYVDFKEMPDTTQLHKIKCVDTFGCGLEVCDMLSGYSPNYKKEIQVLADRWNRRPKITEEEVREQCRARNQMVISGELFHVMFKGISYRPDEMPIDGVAAYRIGKHKTLWLTVPNGTVKDDKLGGRIIVEEANTPYVATYYRGDDE